MISLASIGFMKKELREGGGRNSEKWELVGLALSEVLGPIFAKKSLKQFAILCSSEIKRSLAVMQLIDPLFDKLLVASFIVCQTLRE